MTVQEARNILGDNYKDLSDDEIKDIVSKFSYLADTFLNRKEIEIFGLTVKDIVDGKDSYE